VPWDFSRVPVRSSERHHRGFPIPSPAVLGENGDAFRQAMPRYAEANGIPWIKFGKDDRKLGVIRPTRRGGLFCTLRFPPLGGIVLLVCQAKMGTEAAFLDIPADQSLSIFQAFPVQIDFRS
jgi:hypothetical protein